MNSINLGLSSCSMRLSTKDAYDIDKEFELGFTKAVVFNEVIYGSGQVRWDTDFRVLTYSNYNNQFEQTLHNIELLIQNQGCIRQAVLFLRFYSLDIDSTDVKLYGIFLKVTYPNNIHPLSLC